MKKGFVSAIEGLLSFREGIGFKSVPYFLLDRFFGFVIPSYDVVMSLCRDVHTYFQSKALSTHYEWQRFRQRNMALLVIRSCQIPRGGVIPNKQENIHHFSV